MAAEAQCSSDTGNKKRKYEEQTALSPPPPRRPTGFTSGRILSAPPPGAGRFDAKRVRDEKGSGFDSTVRDGKHMMGTALAIPVSYDYSQGTSKTIDIPNGRVGVIIGKAGKTIKHIMHQSGANIEVTHDVDADPNLPTRPAKLMGTPEQIAKAEQLINDVLAGVEAGGSGIISKRVTGQTGSNQFVMKIPDNKVGLVIGKGGKKIQYMQAVTGARIQVVPLRLPPGDPATERKLHIDGTSDQIEAAKKWVNEVISEVKTVTTFVTMNTTFTNLL